ncbi:ASCH domain-containing protein [Schleiferilactobacillus shenzhenensis]|uniref:ASCH domain-containing protein n=1 Tax=Schleiferilactobacillus shenzhenensis LY-73 TaxID=1231336 RepID=U4TZ69_9LACO|nr:ASCH domain-containing protein [Schleiferilactobacillus shenzhenensis]ERL66607.1 hypothetical protein L248_0286 [Schleiferilactobacillus shenzhenensis LY-73]
MQAYQLHLYADQYDLVKAGTKTVEIRLRTPEIDKVQPSDVFHFLPVPARGGEELTAVVIDINQFDTFEQGLRHFPPTAVGSPAGTSVADMVRAMYQIYTPQQEAAHGVVFFTIHAVPTA